MHIFFKSIISVINDNPIYKQKYISPKRNSRVSHPKHSTRIKKTKDTLFYVVSMAGGETVVGIAFPLATIVNFCKQNMLITTIIASRDATQLSSRLSLAYAS